MRARGAALLLVAGLLLLVACAPRGPTALSPTQLHARASRAIPAAFDEVYDATWLTLEAAGWTVREHDRRAGTLSTNAILAPNGTSRAWEGTVSQEGASPVVTLLPHIYEGTREVTADMHWTLEGPGGESARWDVLFAGIVGLVDAWRVHPELTLSNSRGELDAVGLRLLVPDWPQFTFATDRRTLLMQSGKLGHVDALLYRIERRRPDPDLGSAVHEALEAAFHAPGRVVEPSEWAPVRDTWGETGVGEVRVGANLTGHAVRWRRWEAGNPAWVVRVVAACHQGHGETCEGEARRVIESAVNTSPTPGLRAR